MCPESVIRRLAGIVVLVSVALGFWVHPAWLALTAFAGFNLLQSSFTNVCLPERLFAAFGWFGCAPRVRVAPGTDRSPPA